jgi:hypothetical protein
MLKHVTIAGVCAALLLLIGSQGVQAQSVKWVVGGNMGISIASGGGGSSAGFHFGPMGEVIFNRALAVGTEFNINTQTGTPVEWANYFKYYIDAKSAKIKPYVDGGFGLLFLTGGPYFGIRFGGGVGFQVAKGIYVGPDLQLGPVFATGLTVFYITIRGGFRYEIP